MQILESLYTNIREDMNREEFKVSDKYRTKYEELGKLRETTLHLSLSPSSPLSSYSDSHSINQSLSILTS
jgi:hypothetical protein